MAAQVSAGSISDTQFLDTAGITQPALLQIPNRFRISVQLHLVEGMRVFQQLGISIRNQFLLEERNALTKGQVAEELNEADQRSSYAAAGTPAAEGVVSAVPNPHPWCGFPFHGQA